MGTEAPEEVEKVIRAAPALVLDHLSETRVVVPCDLPEGATVLGEETSTRLGGLRGGPVKLVVARTKY